MDEEQFRQLYAQINQQRCVFEKALLNQRVNCSQQQRFLLANREGVGCKSATSLALCQAFLALLRSNSRFALGQTTSDEPLPHTKELKVQAGGILALQHILQPEQANTDIATLLPQALEHYSTLTALPYGELIKGVVHYSARPKHRLS